MTDILDELKKPGIDPRKEFKGLEFSAKINDLEDSNEDGFRILVDRLWPRGLSKEKAKVNLWLKEIAHSEGLRKWFAHETGKWDEFCKRYWMELEQKKDLITLIEEKNKEETVTFVYAAHDEKNNAWALKMFIDSPA